MKFRERIEAVWAGERPDVIPYSIYEWIWSGQRHDPAWEAMFAEGLGLTHHVFAYDTEMQDVEVEDVRGQEDGHDVRRLTYTTPVGSVTETWADGWQGECFLKEPADYHTMVWIVDHTTITPRLDRIKAKLAACGPHEAVWSAMKRNPYQRMLVDWAGVGNFPFHLADFEEDVRALYEALRREFRKRTEIAAQAPGRFVHFGENFNAAAIGPDRYAEFILPVYEECIGMLHDAGKIVGAHYDGHTANCAAVINRSPLDLVESFTEPPEGDQTLAQARANWPEKLLWCNIGLNEYDLPLDELHDRIQAMAADGAPDGKRLAFEVSENLPANWRDAMPVVLAALKEMSA